MFRAAQPDRPVIALWFAIALSVLPSCGEELVAGATCETACDHAWNTCHEPIGDDEAACRTTCSSAPWTWVEIDCRSSHCGEEVDQCLVDSVTGASPAY